MNKKKYLFFLILILFLIMVLISIISVKTYNKYKIWNLHKDYFKQDKSKQKIEDWMTVRLIENKYHINIENELNISLNFYEKRKTLSDICNEKNIDCKEVIKKLNKK